MRFVNFFSILISLIGIGLLFRSVTHSYFSDSASSTSNVFAAAAQFPTPTSGVTSTVTITPTPTVGFGSVVINEINWAGNNTTIADEWIELRNMTSHSIDISGWAIVNLGTSALPSFTIGSGKTIPASGFFLISNNNKTTSKINVDPDIESTAVDLDNDGELLTLKNNFGSTIDVANQVGSWFKGSNSSPKKSMERKDPPGDGTSGGKWNDSTGHNNMDGTTSNDEFGSPKAANP